MKKPFLRYRTRKSLRGFGFISVWLAGTFLWFIIPAVNSIKYSFSSYNPVLGKHSGEWKGLDNYIYAFTEDALYPDELWNALKNTLTMTPMIVIFSLFAAVLINRKFKGKNFVSAVFFLPVIIASGSVYNIISQDISGTRTNSAAQFSDMFNTDILGDFLRISGISRTGYFSVESAEKISAEILSLIWYSGIQIIIFLVALRTIPRSAYEIACIEGATEWEYFWKVTVPYVSPAITANIILTTINTFTYQNNNVMKRILDMQAQWNYGRASAMAWSYFAIILIFTGITVFIVRKILNWNQEE